MKRISKNDYYMTIAQAVSQRSTCLKRHYGAVIVKDDEIIATGYNGSARGTDNCCDIHSVCPRANIPHNSGNYAGCPAIHAEQNAIISASRHDMIGATIYLAGFERLPNSDDWVSITTCEPCPICSNMIANAGITTIIGSFDDDSYLVTNQHTVNATQTLIGILELPAHRLDQLNDSLFISGKQLRETFELSADDTLYTETVYLMDGYAMEFCIQMPAADNDFPHLEVSLYHHSELVDSDSGDNIEHEWTMTDPFAPTPTEITVTVMRK